MIDEKKVCFITCVNNKDIYKKSLLYINSLNIPAGYEMEVICLEDPLGLYNG